MPISVERSLLIIVVADWLYLQQGQFRLYYSAGKKKSRKS